MEVSDRTAPIIRDISCACASSNASTANGAVIERRIRMAQVPAHQELRHIRLRGPAFAQQGAGAGTGARASGSSSAAMSSRSGQRHRQDSRRPRARSCRLSEAATALRLSRPPRSCTNSWRRATSAGYECARSSCASVKLLIIDELGYVPFTAVGGELLFEVLSQRYERGSTLITSQSAVRRMDQRVRLRTPHRRTARPADPPCPHPRNERRQLPPRHKPQAAEALRTRNRRRPMT